MVEHYRETATAPAYDLVLAVRRWSLRYIGHVIRMPAERMVRRALMALLSDIVVYPTGSLFSALTSIIIEVSGSVTALTQRVAMASNSAMCRAKVASLS